MHATMSHVKAVSWQDKLYETLPNVLHLATAKNVARQVAETVAESRIGFYFPQRFM